MDIKKLIELKKQMKKKKPSFRRQDSHKLKCLAAESWRKPKGHQSKIRTCRKGYGRLVSIGYGAPAKTKHLHKSGLHIIMVSNAAELDNLHPQKTILLLAKTGRRKRIEILKKAAEKKFTILNIKDPQKFIADAEESIKKGREEKTKRVEEKKEKKKRLEKEATKKQKEKESIEEALSDEEKKEQEKKEIDKALIHTD